MRASRRRIVVKSGLVLASLFTVVITGCSGKLSSTNSQPSPAAAPKSTPQNGAGQQTQNASAAGEATGSYTANGETVVLTGSKREAYLRNEKQAGLIQYQLVMKYTPQGAPCPCGSGQKFKRCHGKAVHYKN